MDKSNFIEKFVQKCVDNVQNQLKDEAKKVIITFNFSDWDEEESYRATKELSSRLHNLGYTIFLNRRVGRVEEWEVSIRCKPKNNILDKG